MSDALDGRLFGDDQPCFGCGPNHPTGFRLRFERDGDEVVTRFVPRERDQSAPNVMHGGLLFTLADELAGWAVIAATGKFGFTVRFSGKLSRPVRPGLECEGRARVTKKSARLAEVDARVSQAGELAFAGSFTFAVLDEAAAEKLMGRPLPEGWKRFAL